MPRGPGPTNAKGALDGPASSGKAMGDLLVLFDAAGVKGRFVPWIGSNVYLPSGVKDAGACIGDEGKWHFFLMKFESAARAEEFARYKELDRDPSLLGGPVKLYQNGEFVLELQSGSPNEQLILETFRKF